MINAQSYGDARHVNTGKDGSFYDEDGILLATVESFQSMVNFNNASYSVLGNAQVLETPQTFSVSLAMSQVVVEDDRFILEIFDALEKQEMPSWTFQGSLLGRNGSEERVVYRGCVPSGQIDIQNISVESIAKRSWNLHVNQPPALATLLSVDRN